jgi:Mor family transcriptional regulator
VTDLYGTYTTELTARFKKRLNDSDAEIVAELAADTLRQMYDRQRRFFPKLTHIERQARNKAIRVLYVGSNVKELARKFDCHRATIYRVLNLGHKRRGRRG